MTLKLKFDPNQDYQLDAVNSVAQLLEGFSRRATDFRLVSSEDIIPNLPPSDDLNEMWLADNLRQVQERNGVFPDKLRLDLEIETGLGLIGDRSYRYPSFTIEMETGTGKTYVYLRTIYELRRQYGFSKFIVVVPSIAIYEGVIKNFKITLDHFRALYANEVVNLIEYDGSQLSRLRSFATSTFCEILVITLDSFNKASNVIYRTSEKLPGERRPYQFLQETRPILILDEPQNMTSALSKQALGTLNPLFALRYSATHRETPNPIYRLTPFEAFRRNLVKKIQVSGVTQREDFNLPFLALEQVTGRPITARVRTRVTEGGRTREATLTLKQDDDLHAKTKREEYIGYVVSEIHAGAGYVDFENGARLQLDGAVSPSRPEIFRVQIEETIKRHLDLQKQLRPRGIKVLSLFFIDRVANYVEKDGLIRTLFDRAFDKLKVDYPAFAKLKAEQVRDGYFAKKKTKTGEEAIDTEGRNAAEREAEKAAFELIMRDKERLLSFGEPVSFIFAHSALREGWDNPNVFQICTLREMSSETDRRQTLGRGLRLCVNQEGERVFGDDVNVLTVIANESYSAYAESLQQEYREDGDEPPPPPTDARRVEARRSDKIFRQSPDFKAFWEKLARRADYRIEVDTPVLIRDCVARLNKQTFPEPLIVVESGRFVQTHYTMRLQKVDAKRAFIQIKSLDSDGQTNMFERYFREHDELAKTLKDDTLKPYHIVEIRGTGNQATVVFGNGVELSVGAPHEFGGQPAHATREKAMLAPQSKYPVFNLIDRAARETGLTRPTVNAIFKQMRAEKKRAILRNPEGFAGVFITELKNALADQVANSIVFEISEKVDQPLDLDELFPRTRKFPQRELFEAGEYGLYDQLQLDSQVENDFLAKVKDDDQVVLFFKFPPAFKVKLPRLIGNYNPDWGLVRRRADGKYIVQLIRETKGGPTDTLRFPHEKRKVRCAEAYFEALEMDYRQVYPPFKGWWMLTSELGQQDELRGMK